MHPLQLLLLFSFMSVYLNFVLDSVYACLLHVKMLWPSLLLCNHIYGQQSSMFDVDSCTFKLLLNQSFSRSIFYTSFFLPIGNVGFYENVGTNDKRKEKELDKKKLRCFGMHK